MYQRGYTFWTYKNVAFDESFGRFFIETNLRSKKWLLGCSYNHRQDNITPHLSNMEYHFLNIFTEILNKHARWNKNILEQTNGGFMTKDLHKTIMKRSGLRNTFLRDRADISREE